MSAPRSPVLAAIRAVIRHTGLVTDIAFTPDGQVVATGARDIRLWEVASGQLLRIIQGHTDWVVGVAFAPDRQTPASASWDHAIKLWRVSDGFIDGVAGLMARLSAGMRQIQTGYIRNYALMFLLGVVLLISYFVLQ